MIILKILLFILLAVIGIILLILIAPVGAEVSFIDGKFRFCVKASFLTVMNSDGGGVLGWLKKRKKKPKKDKPVKEKKPKKNKKKKSVVNDEDFLEDFDFDLPDDFDFELNDIENDDADSDIPMTDSSEDEIAWSDDDNDVKKKKKSRKKKKSEDEYEDEPEEKKKRTVSDWIELLVGIWESAQRPLLKIFKGFHFHDLYIDFEIANEDAYKCALNYGKISGSVYNILGAMCTLFTVRLKTVDIFPKFGENKGRWDCSCRIFFRAGTVVIAGLWFLITYLFRTFIPNKIKNKKLKKIKPQGRNEVI